MADEPYRLFFPLGWAVAVIGVLLWPLFLLGLLPVFPIVAHQRLMVVGFLGAFALGFLGTALPRMTHTRRLHPLEVAATALLLCCTVVIYLLQPAAALLPDVLSVLLLALMALIFLPRILCASQPLPPPFVLIAGAWLMAVTGLGLMIALGGETAYAVWYSLGRTMLNEIASLLLIMGAAPAIIPRLFGFRHRLAASPLTVSGVVRRGIAPRTKELAIALVAGTGILVALALETFVSASLGLVLRCAAAGGYFLAILSPGGVLRLVREPAAGGVAVSLIAISAAPLIHAIDPAWRQVSLHALFLTGYAMLTLLVGWQVVLAHSRMPSSARGESVVAGPFVGLVLGSLVLRSMAEFQPHHHGLWIGMAAGVWLGALNLWAVVALPRALRLPTC